jgi:hypothetical protein
MLQYNLINFAMLNELQLHLTQEFEMFPSAPSSFRLDSLSRKRRLYLSRTASSTCGLDK